MGLPLTSQHQHTNDSAACEPQCFRPRHLVALRQSKTEVDVTLWFQGKRQCWAHAPVPTQRRCPVGKLQPRELHKGCVLQALQHLRAD